jgi:hypothetical protein
MTLPLADRAGTITAVDADREMLDEGARLAVQSGHDNIRWAHLSAEDFEDQPATYRAVVIGSAFHWMNRDLVAAKAHRLLARGGVLAVVGNPTPLIQVRQRRGVGGAIATVQGRWMPNSAASPSVDGLSRPEQVIAASPFRTSTLRHVPTEQHWDIPSLVGFLRSTSFRPDHILGDQFDDFVTDLTQAVLAVEPTGRWALHASVEMVIAHKQAHT